MCRLLRLKHTFAHTCKSSETKVVKETESLIWLLGLGKRAGAFFVMTASKPS